MIKEEFKWIKPFIDKYIDFSSGKDNVPKDYVTDVFSEQAKKDAQDLGDVEIAYKIRKWYLITRNKPENVSTILVTFKRRSSNNDRKSIIFKSSESGKPGLGYTVLVTNSKKEGMLVYDAVNYDKPVELDEYIRNLATVNKCTAKTLRYDTTYLGVLNFGGTGNSYLTYNTLLTLDRTLGKAQGNMLIGDEVVKYGNDIIAPVIPDKTFAAVANVINHTRMQALTNVQIEGIARTLYYNLAGIEPSAITSFSNKELLEQDYEMYTEDELWLTIGVTLRGF